MSQTKVQKTLITRLRSHYDTNKFYTLNTKGTSGLTFFMLRKHITHNITISSDCIYISGVCESYQIYDSSTLFLGYLFETPKKNTVVSPIMLSVKIPPDQDVYEEVQLPPKYGVLAYRSSNSSTLVIAQEELNLQYIVKDIV